jgi:hypothetical protein
MGAYVDLHDVALLEDKIIGLGWSVVSGDLIYTNVDRECALPTLI